MKKPALWFVASGVSAVVPIAVAAVATNETLSLLTFPGVYTSVVQLVLAFAFAIIECAMPLDTWDSQVTTAEKI